MNVDKKTDLFENTPVRNAVLTLAIPSVLASLVMILYNLADTYFVGMLNNEIQTSAVTLAAPVILAFNAVNNLFGIGCSSRISRSLGEKDYDTVRKTSAFGCYGAIISGALFSIIFTALRPFFLNVLGASAENIAETSDYLFWTVTCGAIPSILNVVMAQIIKSDGSAVHAAIGTMSGCLLNVVLDPVFILPWGLNMGAAGAGCATFISNTFACAYFFVILFVKRNETYISVRPSNFKPTSAIVKDVCVVGIPGSIQNLLNVTGMTILNNFMAEYGSAAVSAAGISHKTVLIPLYVAMGITQGVTPLVGYNYASGNRKRMRDSVVFTAEISMVIMIAATVICWAFTPGIVRLFMDNDQVVEYGTAFMRGMSLAQPFLCIDFLAVGVFQACGMGGKALLFAFLRKIVLEIPAMILLNKLVPMYGLAYAQLVAEFILSVIAIIEMKKIFKETSPCIQK